MEGIVRRALLVGIDAYPTAPLEGCVKDAKRMAELLAWHEDATPNFDCRTLVAPSDNIRRKVLWSQIEKLFAQPADAALLYFAGHGAIHKNLGGYIFAQDSRHYTEAISMRDVMSLAHGGAKIGEVIIILDCC